MHESVTGLPRVPSAEDGFFFGITSHGNKERARLVSAAAVIPALRVVGMIIGLKASVAGLASFLLNPATQSLDRGKYY